MSRTILDTRQVESREVLDAIGTDSFTDLKDVLKQINDNEDLLRIKPESTISQRVAVTSAQVSKDLGHSGGLLIRSKLVKFDGVVIDFQTGEVFEADGTTSYLAGANDFTPVVLEEDEYVYYAISLKSGSTNADNTIQLEVVVTPASSVNTVLASAPKANFGSGIPVGQVWVKENGTNTGLENINWANISQMSSTGGGGGTSGAPSSTDNAIVRFDGTTGDSLQNSVVTISDTGEVEGATRLDVDNIRVDGNTISSTNSNGNINLSPNGTGIVIIDKRVELAKGANYTMANDAVSGSNQTLTAVDTGIVRLTNPSLSSVDMIPAGVQGRTFVLINATGGDVTINDNTGATASNRILTGTKSPLVLKDESSMVLTYDSTETRWMVIAGTGDFDLGYTSFNIANNQSSPTDVTGVAFDYIKNKNFILDYNLFRSTSSTSAAQTGRLRGVYNTVTSTWFISDDYSGENAGVEFTITTLGQIQYTSSNLSGTGYTGTLEYRAVVGDGLYTLGVMTTNGDMIMRSAGVPTRLPVGANDSLLKVTSGLPSWTNNLLVTANTLTFRNNTAGGTSIIEVGGSGTGNRFSLIDFTGDDTYTDNGLRIGRENTGPNTNSIFNHRGTGRIIIQAIDAGSIGLYTNSIERATIASTGDIAINTFINSLTKLQAQGSQNTVIATATGSLGAIEVLGAGGATAAYMAFHRPGAYAVYFGLDTDNFLRVGGWSMGANSQRVFHGDAPGSAPVYACRAWVNFNGTGTIGANQTIRASGNVSTVFKNATGDYLISFSSDMVDTNYATIGSCRRGVTDNNVDFSFFNGTTYSTSQVRILTRASNTGTTSVDADMVNVAILR